MNDNASEALDRYLFGEEEQGYNDASGELLECRYCGEDDVEWAKLPSGKWWLHEYNEVTDEYDIPHKCKKEKCHD